MFSALVLCFSVLINCSHAWEPYNGVTKKANIKIMNRVLKKTQLKTVFGFPWYPSG